VVTLDVADLTSRTAQEILKLRRRGEKLPALLRNAHIDELIATGILRRLLVLTKLKFSNSMSEAWWRSLKIG